MNSACGNYRQTQVNRRQLLQLGGLFGLGLPQLLRAESTRQRRKASAKAVIFLHQFGGPSHVDTFDLKPKAPEGVRSELKAIQSKLAGVPVCELLPRMAKVLDKVCQVRTMTHTMKNHNSATYYSLTGHAPPVDDIRLRDSLDLFPAYGSVVDKLAPVQKGMPTFVAYPHVLRDGSLTPGQHGSFLGKMHNPLLITRDPNRPDFKLPELGLPGNLTLDRLKNRRKVMQLIDRQSELLEFSATAQGIDKFYERAITMLTSPKVKKAFDLSGEPEAVRDKYGRTSYGQSCLLARRLVEAGAKFINVYFASRIGGRTNSGGWDTHGFGGNPMYPILKNYLIPTTDHTVPALLTDLEERGLLKDTLVVWMGEFGRSPRINNIAGRDHWPQCYTALLAGGGVKPGFVYGKSDRTGAYPASHPVKPDDLAATIFSLLGIDPHTEILDTLNRPFPIANGKVVEGIIA